MAVDATPLARPRQGATLAALRTQAAHCRECPLGALAARTVWGGRPDGIGVLVTLHPSALLRGDPSERESAFARWIADLQVASPFVAPA